MSVETDQTNGADGAQPVGGDEGETVDAAFLRRQWDRIAAWCCVVVGAMALLIGWMGVSDTPYPAEQIPFVISGGIGGVFLLGVGAMLWISADIHDEWRKLEEIDELLRSRSDLDRRVISKDPVTVGAGAAASTNGTSGRIRRAARSKDDAGQG